MGIPIFSPREPLEQVGEAPGEQSSWETQVVPKVEVGFKVPSPTTRPGFRAQIFGTDRPNIGCYILECSDCSVGRGRKSIRML